MPSELEEEPHTLIKAQNALLSVGLTPEKIEEAVIVLLSRGGDLMAYGNDPYWLDAQGDLIVAQSRFIASTFSPLTSEYSQMIVDFRRAERAWEKCKETYLYDDYEFNKGRRIFLNAQRALIKMQITFIRNTNACGELEVP